jgi:hypothetical protein
MGHDCGKKEAAAALPPPRKSKSMTAVQSKVRTVQRYLYLKMKKSGVLDDP